MKYTKLFVSLGIALAFGAGMLVTQFIELRTATAVDGVAANYIWNAQMGPPGAVFPQAASITLSGPITTSQSLMVGGSFQMGSNLISATNNKVGIGTASPTYKLDVAGQANAQQICLGGVCKTSWPDCY